MTTRSSGPAYGTYSTRSRTSRPWVRRRRARGSFRGALTEAGCRLDRRRDARKSGIEATPELLKESPASKVLVLSMQDDPSYVREAFAVGASGYVLKEGSR